MTDRSSGENVHLIELLLAVPSNWLNAFCKPASSPSSTSRPPMDSGGCLASVQSSIATPATEWKGFVKTHSAPRSTKFACVEARVSLVMKIGRAHV